jgi:hypothetical protein
MTPTAGYPPFSIVAAFKAFIIVTATEISMI